jgi:DNA primase catalytic core
VVNNQLCILKENVKTYLPRYLQQLGINPNKQFRCLDPSHVDGHPSMGVVKNNGSYLHCFSCGANLDIFDVASIKENKPTSGPDWVKGNLFYLADKFSIEVPNLATSKEDSLELEKLRAYSHAAQIVRQSTRSEVVINKIKDYGWGTDLCDKLSIGTVESYDAYITKMTTFYKYQLQFLKDCDLDNKGIFQATNLIYTIKDEHGSPVAFAARDLLYEQKKLDYDAKKAKDPESDVWRPSKYINSNSKSGIFHKSKTLYLFYQIKPKTDAILIVEGQADAVTCNSGGIHNVAGICSTAFTKDHLKMILDYGIKHIIFLLDSDDAGQKATDKFINLAEQCRTESELYDLRVEAIVLPEGQDPDSYIRSFGNNKLGVQNLRKLLRIDSFSWQITKALEFGEDPITLCNRVLPIIAKEPNNIFREHRASQLSDATKIEKAFVYRELLKLIESQTIKTEAERASTIKEIASSLGKALKQFTLLFPNDTI